MPDARHDPTSPAFADRRAEARRVLDALDPAMQAEADADPLRRAWFETVYARAECDPARVPWASLAPHRLTREWIAGQGAVLTGLRVLDVGCGLGDNAECFAAAGAEVDAFDLVPAAIAWAQQRFPQSAVRYCAADLLNLPSGWRGRFDLVHECYTLQALTVSVVPRALACLAAMLAPGGRLLIIARARDEDESVSRPPWPLPPSVFDDMRRNGLQPRLIEDIAATADGGRRHWRAVLERA